MPSFFFAQDSPDQIHVDEFDIFSVIEQVRRDIRTCTSDDIEFHVNPNSHNSSRSASSEGGEISEVWNENKIGMIDDSSIPRHASKLHDRPKNIQSVRSQPVVEGSSLSVQICGESHAFLPIDTNERDIEHINSNIKNRFLLTNHLQPSVMSTKANCKKQSSEYPNMLTYSDDDLSEADESSESEAADIPTRRNGGHLETEESEIAELHGKSFSRYLPSHLTPIPSIPTTTTTSSTLFPKRPPVEKKKAALPSRILYRKYGKADHLTEHSKHAQKERISKKLPPIRSYSDELHIEGKSASSFSFVSAAISVSSSLPRRPR